MEQEKQAMLLQEMRWQERRSRHSVTMLQLQAVESRSSISRNTKAQKLHQHAGVFKLQRKEAVQRKMSNFENRNRIYLG